MDATGIKKHNAMKLSSIRQAGDHVDENEEDKVEGLAESSKRAAEVKAPTVR